MTVYRTHSNTHTLTYVRCVNICYTYDVHWSKHAHEIRYHDKSAIVYKDAEWSYNNRIALKITEEKNKNNDPLKLIAQCRRAHTSKFEIRLNTKFSWLTLPFTRLKYKTTFYRSLFAPMLRSKFIESNQCHSFFSTHMSIKLLFVWNCNFCIAIVCFPTSC